MLDLPVSGAEELIARYGATAGYLAAGGGASILIWRKAVRPAIHNTASFVRRTLALYDKMEYQLAPNGGSSLVDVVKRIDEEQGRAKEHRNLIEQNLVQTQQTQHDYQSKVVSRLDEINHRLSEGEARFDTIEKAIHEGVRTLKQEAS